MRHGSQPGPSKVNGLVQLKESNANAHAMLRPSMIEAEGVSEGVGKGVA